MVLNPLIILLKFWFNNYSYFLKKFIIRYVNPTFLSYLWYVGQSNYQFRFNFTLYIPFYIIHFLAWIDCIRFLFKIRNHRSYTHIPTLIFINLLIYLNSFDFHSKFLNYYFRFFWFININLEFLLLILQFFEPNYLFFTMIRFKKYLFKIVIILCPFLSILSLPWHLTDFFKCFKINRLPLDTLFLFFI